MRSSILYLLLGIVACAWSAEDCCTAQLQPGVVPAGADGERPLQESSRLDVNPSPPTGATIRFKQASAKVGERVEQQIGVRLQLTTQIVQSGQIAHKSVNDLGREQRRTVEVLEATDDALSKARVTFLSSRNQTPENANPDHLSPQAIHGKTYVIERDGERLKVADADGAIPPMDEYELVMETLENLGKPHPLTPFLLDRPWTVGQRMLLPRETAEELLGLGAQLGTVRRFQLTLLSLESGDLSPEPQRAVFEAAIETIADEQCPLEMTITGRIVMEISTCRSLAADFQGPVQMSTIERTSEGIFQYSAGGEVRVVIRASYDLR